MDLNALAELFSRGEIKTGGLEATPEGAIALAEQKFPGKPYCLVGVASENGK
jgi:hypothetical protein